MDFKQALRFKSCGILEKNRSYVFKGILETAEQLNIKELFGISEQLFFVAVLGLTQGCVRRDV